MTAVTALLNLSQAVQAVALLGNNVRVATKKKVKTKDLIGLGITNIVGVGLIKAQADISASL